MGIPAELVGLAIDDSWHARLLGLLIALVVALLRRPGQSDQRQYVSLEKVLAERFARGELDADQYRQCLQVLREGQGRR